MKFLLAISIGHLSQLTQAHHHFPHFVINVQVTGAHYRRPTWVKAGQDVIGFQAYINTESFHPGPLQICLSKAPGDVRDYDGSGDWFKIYQLEHQPGSTNDLAWLSWHKKQFTFKLPAEIPPGQYLMQIEQTTTHPSYTDRGFYIQCAHIEMTSSYNGSPSPGFKIPGVYIREQSFFKYHWAKPQSTVCPLPGPAMSPNNNNVNRIL
ncbi:glycoside hydrolase family 61 protein [Bipolaris maydis ATCC 48331]|uniref:AA9 family lytic polysaccharide monooxygenase n=2 Tax=Cochliobolus heterostrophus TaxID=5016 RepID=M2V8K7_COCH5|nr:glycoside hydrolase family 61 protein [Bipolaris maydis ATCC 48331]EMD96317.1 glycoside hydrolase family 61 protein [Bipolaris maydis C5]KAH7562146.1 glycoside hydrolase family 61 protein [Bipolaris maydis]ENI11177.1 glycoside hydrolase family 61 protein [Bipolaris maydis ATCC 48331]KAJ5020880.1 glycoside hydrolase [Bipolaris maydis]KAJ5030971.1 glycoside hydrolase [Bipolaris maydis]